MPGFANDQHRGELRGKPDQRLVPQPGRAWLGQELKFDHDFIGRKALEPEVANPKRLMRTLVWNADDVVDVYASMFRDARPYDYMDMPRDQRGFMYADKVIKNGKVVGCRRREATAITSAKCCPLHLDVACCEPERSCHKQKNPPRPPTQPTPPPPPPPPKKKLRHTTPPPPPPPPTSPPPPYAAMLINAAVVATKGDLSDKEAVRKSMEKADFESVRGKFRFGNNHIPIQNFYLQEAIKDGDGYVLKTVATIVEDSQDRFHDQCPMK